MAKRLSVPELLAPAGDEECMRAAVNAGADAVYFGLRDGFNARARAMNFALDDLPRIFEELHRKGVKGFVTMNTLVFDSELAAAERALLAIERAGADAIIVQDLGVARLAQAVCPELELHASTQMTLSSAEGARIAAELGISRVVLPRELSLEEIRRFAAETDLELEAFVHGALCMSWSGQCLTSEALQSRSANRGQCAQSCRLPYELWVDGKRREVRDQTGDVRYLLSPRDLAAYQLLPELIEAGVSCFKLEGRMKGVEYVTNAVDKYRRALDRALEKDPSPPLSAQDVRELRATFSREFSTGFFAGSDHQTLVHGRYPGHRGLAFGRVERVDVARGHVYVLADAGEPAPGPGDRILFDQDRPEEEEPRGTLFGVDDLGASRFKLVFGGKEVGRQGKGAELARVRAGDRVWQARDAALARKLKRIAETERKLALEVHVSGAAGARLQVTGRDTLGREAQVESGEPLAAARGEPLGESVIREKLCAFGESRFTLGALSLALDGRVWLPPAELKRMRRALCEALEAQAVPQKNPVPRAAVPLVRSPRRRAEETAPRSRPLLVPLLRTLAQVDAALGAKTELGLEDVTLDFMELVGLGEAVERVRAAGLRAIIATPRVQKPGEEGYDRRFRKLAPDGILARHWGALEHFRREGVHRAFTLHADFSLNATNALTADAVLALGVHTLTPSYDLDAAQLFALCEGVDPARLEVTLHQHLPLYHTEHCVYAHTLSSGRDYRSCGRPCEEHLVALRDPQGLAHPVIVDVGCRNTVFNARAQSAANISERLLAAGVGRFRVELVRESAEETAVVLSTYRALLDGVIDAKSAIKRVGALEKYGVTSGTLAIVA